ncbi:MAG: hypothetical protein OEX07_15315, partial [Gammaproteobacteria bacterium]|nr:hypothetical protein [Gammaproteobacteria bacterium]
MKLRPIKDALAGEWLLGVYPVMSPEVDAGWNRRLNYFTSRALSHTALQTEQENRGAHLATMGQSVSHGVINGLEVSVDKSGQRIMISPGAGVTITGEDVFVPRGLNIDIRDVRVYEAVTNVPTDTTLTVSPGTGISGLTGSSGLTGKPIDIVVKPGTITGTFSSSKKTDILSLVSGKIKNGGLSRVDSAGSINLFPSSSTSLTFTSSADTTFDSSGADLFARKLGSSIGDHIDENEPLAEVGFLILQPVAVDIRGDNEERDPCEEDPLNDAFENWQIADGCRLIYYAWPSDYLPPEYREVTSLTDSDLSWRNRLAHKIFNKEKTVSYHPWDETGVPIAMVGFNNEWKLQFCDRYAVVREGGKPRWRTIRNNTSGSAFLWQSRVQQFNQQISEITTNRASALTLSGLTFETEAEKKRYLQQQIQEVRHSFIYLPPVGMLPKQAIDFENNEHYFFRPDYHVEAVAVPLEQLDLA